MRPETRVRIFEEGGKLVSDLARIFVSRPTRKSTSETTVTENTPTSEYTKITPAPEPEPTHTPTATTTLTPEDYKEIDYRWECCMKHLGAAQGLLHEAFERANDEGIGDGTAEKVMEAMNQHSTMESDDLPAMLAIPESRPHAEKLMSGIRAFRKAAWEANLPRGGGTKDDVADAKLWNNILYQEAFANAKAQPGEACIAEGM